MPPKKQSKPWPADKVERRAVADLIPYANNARTHSDSQIEQIMASMQEFGWTNPVLIGEDGVIIAGHGRIMAAQRLGIEEAPCMVAVGLTEAQKKAYVIADNKLAENAGWDFDVLRMEFGDLAEMDFDLTVTGFDMDEVAGILEDGSDNNGGLGSGAGSLADKFGVPPFSVLNAREGWWQDRKRAWLSIGIASELGRGEQLIPNGGGAASRERYANAGAKASPGGALMPSADYSKRQRGNGKGQAIG